MNFYDIRGQWQKAGLSWYTRPTSDIDTITVHHSASNNQRNLSDEAYLREIYNAHVNQGWAGISYHIVYIPKSGNFYWINDFTKVTWHDTYNWGSIGVLILGYFHPDVNNPVTQDIKAALQWILDKLCTEHPEFPADQNNVYGHREIPTASTACPGNAMIPFVVDYRSKQGGVNWTNNSQLINSNQSMNIDSAQYGKLISAATTRKEVAENYGIPFPESDSADSKKIIEKIDKTINAYKGQVSTAQAAEQEARKSLATSAQEVKNREEQVSRLKVELTNTVILYEARIEEVKKQAGEGSIYVQTLEAQLKQVRDDYDAAMKLKGGMQTELAEALELNTILKEQLEQYKKGNTPAGKSLFDVVKDFLSSFVKQ